MGSSTIIRAGKRVSEVWRAKRWALYRFWGKGVLESSEKSLYHTVTSPEAAQGVLNGINKRFLNPDSRFGRAFYLSEQPGITLAELEHHRIVGADTIRFIFNSKNAKILDLTDPRIARRWGYEGGKFHRLQKILDCVLKSLVLVLLNILPNVVLVQI